jgi:hypothetical protein
MQQSQEFSMTNLSLNWSNAWLFMQLHQRTNAVTLRDLEFHCCSVAPFGGCGL